MTELEKIIYKDAIDDAREMLIDLAEKMLDEGNPSSARVTAEAARHIAELRKKV